MKADLTRFDESGNSPGSRGWRSHACLVFQMKFIKFSKERETEKLYNFPAFFRLNVRILRIYFTLWAFGTVGLARRITGNLNFFWKNKNDFSVTEQQLPCLQASNLSEISNGQVESVWPKEEKLSVCQWRSLFLDEFNIALNMSTDSLAQT